jgi:antitoxin MazE
MYAPEDQFMKARIVQIGNSQGIRLPKQLLEQTGLQGDVEIRAAKNGIVITALRKPRDGWAESARALADAGENELLDDGGPTTTFDSEDWEW